MPRMILTASITTVILLAGIVLPASSSAERKPQSRASGDKSAPTVVSIRYSPSTVKARRGSTILKVTTVIRDNYSGFGQGAGLAIGFKSDRGGQFTAAAEVGGPQSVRSRVTRQSDAAQSTSEGSSAPTSAAAQPTTSTNMGDQLGMTEPPLEVGSTFWKCPDHAAYEAIGSYRCRDSFTITRIIDGRVVEGTVESYYLIPRFAKRGRWYLHCGLPNVNDLAGNRRIYYVEGVCDPKQLEASSTGTVMTPIPVKKASQSGSTLVPFFTVD